MRLARRIDLCRRDSQPPGLCLAGKPGQHRGVSAEHWRLQCVEPFDDLGERQGRGNQFEAGRPAVAGRQCRAEPGGVHGRWGGDQRDAEPGRHVEHGCCAGLRSGRGPARRSRPSSPIGRTRTARAVPSSRRRPARRSRRESEPVRRHWPASAASTSAPAKTTVGEHLVERRPSCPSWSSPVMSTGRPDQWRSGRCRQGGGGGTASSRRHAAAARADHRAEPGRSARNSMSAARTARLRRPLSRFGRPRESGPMRGRSHRRRPPHNRPTARAVNCGKIAVGQGIRVSGTLQGDAGDCTQEELGK